MGHKSQKQKERKRRQQKNNVEEHHGYHPPKLAWPWWYRCKFYTSGLCEKCSHGQLHLVSPVPGMQMCSGWCAHRDIQVYCVPIRRCRKDEFKEKSHSKDHDDLSIIEMMIDLKEKLVGIVRRLYGFLGSLSSQEAIHFQQEVHTILEKIDAEYPFRCDLCGIRFMTRPKLEYHLLSAEHIDQLNQPSPHLLCNG